MGGLKVEEERREKGTFIRKAHFRKALMKTLHSAYKHIGYAA